MTVKSVVRGVTVGATVGTVCYMMSKATSKQKHDLRKNGIINPYPYILLLVYL